MVSVNIGAVRAATIILQPLQVKRVAYGSIKNPYQVLFIVSVGAEHQLTSSRYVTERSTEGAERSRSGAPKGLRRNGVVRTLGVLRHQRSGQVPY